MKLNAGYKELTRGHNSCGLDVYTKMNVWSKKKCGMVPIKEESRGWFGHNGTPCI